MLRLLVLAVAVSAVAALALWWLSGGTAQPPAEPAVVQLEAFLAGAQPELPGPSVAPAAAPDVEAAPLLLTVDPLTAARAAAARQPSSVPRLDRVDQARLRWDDGAPVVGAVVDVAVGADRSARDALKPSDPPAAMSDAEGRLRFRQLYAGRPHLAIVNHGDLLGVVGLPFEVPSGGDSWPEPLELVVPRPSTLIVEGLDPDRHLSVRLLDQASGSALLQRQVTGAPSTTVEGLPRGAVIDAEVRTGSVALFAGGRATMDADVVRLSVVPGRTPEEASRPGFAWRLVDRRGELLTRERLRDAGLDRHPQSTLTGADAVVTTQALEATDSQCSGWLSPDQPPPWQLSFTLLGGEGAVSDIEPDDEVTLVAPAGVLEDGGQVLRFVASGLASSLGRVDLTSTAGVHRAVFPRPAGEGLPRELRVVLPPGEYSWRTWGGQDTLEPYAVHGDVRVTWADVGTERQIEVAFEQPGALSGGVSVAGVGTLDGGRVVLLPRVASLLPHPPSAEIGSAQSYRFERLAPGDYDVVVYVDVGSATVGLPAGRVQVTSGETSRDLELSLPEPRSLRRLMVTCERGDDVTLVLSDGRGRRFTYALDLNARLAAMLTDHHRARQDHGADWDRGLIPSALPPQITPEIINQARCRAGTLDVPVGLDRYEAWVRRSNPWYVSGFLGGDELVLAHDDDGLVLAHDDDDG